MSYEFVTSINRYRDADSGRFVSRKTLLGYVEGVTSAGQDASDVLADRVSTGVISPAEFETQMRDEIKSATIQDYVLGRGGREQMQPRDWGTIGRQLRGEYKLLAGFRQDIEDDKLSPAQIRARSHLYFETARVAYERGQAAAFDVPPLPAYPCDGTSICVSGCKCSWRFAKLAGDGNTDCFWELDEAAENCETCIQRSQAWSPLQVRGGVLLPFQDIHASVHHEEHVP